MRSAIKDLKGMVAVARTSNGNVTDENPYD